MTDAIKPELPPLPQGWIKAVQWARITPKTGHNVLANADILAVHAVIETAVAAAVAEPIDYPAAIKWCYEHLGHAQGTSGCVAFARGAEWAMRQAAIRAMNPKG